MSGKVGCKRVQNRKPLEIQRQERAFWLNPKAKAYFLKICEASFIARVNWKLFRKNDVKNVFVNLNNAALSMKFRKYYFQSKGVCWYCGEAPKELDNGMCQSCNDKRNKEMKKYYTPVKKRKDEIDGLL